MTKARQPDTFAHAVTQVAARIGWAEAADVAGVKVRMVRTWSEPDRRQNPSLLQAVALDAAYLRAGGGEAPLRAVYDRLIERDAQPPADAYAIAAATALACRETGEATAALVLAAQPGASKADRIVAGREVLQAREALDVALVKLGLDGERVPP